METRFTTIFDLLKEEETENKKEFPNVAGQAGSQGLVYREW